MPDSLPLTDREWPEASDDAPLAAEVAQVEDPLVAEAPVGGLARSLERKRLQAYLGMVLADICVLLCGFGLMSLAYLGTFLDLAELETGLLPAYLLLPLFLTIALYNGSYSRRSLTDWSHAGGRVIIALLIAAALLNFMAFFAKANAEFSRVVFLSGLLLTAIGMLAYRFVLTRVVRRHWGEGAANVLLIQAGGPAVQMPGAISVDARAKGLVAAPDDPAALHRLAGYLRNMDQVVVSCPPEDRLNWSAVLKGSGIRGEIVDQRLQAIGALGVQHYANADLATLMVSTGHLGIRARATKRIFDIMLSAGALLLLSPLMLLVAMAVKLEDGGPVFFVQRRMGRGNRYFDILKFRSMRESDAEGNVSTFRDDARVTRIGRFIRRTSIDELPQLFNVLKGDMSLVGPRPHALGSMAGEKLFWQVDGRYWQRHGLRPGITGLAQIRGHRGATETEDQLTDRLRADLEYLQGWSLWRDIAILASTLRVLVHDRAF